MKQKLIIAAVAAALLTLGGCGNSTHGVGASTGTGESNGTSSSTVISRIKALVRSFTVKASVHMPASALIADAFREHEKMDGIRPSLIRVIAQVAYPQIKQAEDLGKLREALKGKSGPDYDPVILEMVKTGAPDEKLQDRALHNRLLAPLAMAAIPFNGWEVDALSGAPVDQEKVNKWLESLEITALFANTIYTEIAGKLKDDVLADPDTAKQAVLEAFFAIHSDKLWAAWAQANSDARSGGRTIDLAGSRNVHWVKDTRDFEGDQRGLVFTQNGSAWFGDGRLSGKAWEFGLESSIGKNMSKQQSTQEGTDQNSGEKTDAGASAR